MVLSGLIFKNKSLEFLINLSIYSFCGEGMVKINNEISSFKHANLIIITFYGSIFKKSKGQKNDITLPSSIVIVENIPSL
jgi:hypothetical protein